MIENIINALEKFYTPLIGYWENNKMTVIIIGIMIIILALGVMNR